MHRTILPSPPPHRTAPELLTEDEEEEAAVVVEDLITEDEDDVPLVSLGQRFLSDSQFGAVATWVVASPAPGPRQVGELEEEGEVEELEELLKDSPRGSDTTAGSSQGTSKAAGSFWGSSRVASGQGSMAGGSSMGTSKAGGSWAGSRGTREDTRRVMDDSRGTRGQLDDTADEFDRMVVTPRREGEASLRLRLSLSQEVQEEEQEEVQATPEEPRPPSPMSMAGGDTLLEPPGGLNLDGAPHSTTLDSTTRYPSPS